MKVLVTGSSGFIGRKLIKKLENNGINYVGIVRNQNQDNQYKDSRKYIEININENTDWSFPLKNIDCVIHCAARAHVIKETSNKPLESYRSLNVNSTINLAKQCAINGVKRFIFLSSIGVNGNFTTPPKKFSFKDVPSPAEDYAISKLEAEQALKKILSETDLEVVIIRPPLVYGPDVKGNFLRLLNLININFPFPFSLIKNSRSYIGVDNLVDFITLCINHPDAKGNTFLVSDNNDISTPDLIKKLVSRMGKFPIIFPVPIFLLRIIFSLFGLRKNLDRLVQSLQIEYSNKNTNLNWTPSKSLDQGLNEMIESYQKKKI
jgi:nucleoside-diphosphate-sugar epimerase